MLSLHFLAIFFVAFALNTTHCIKAVNQTSVFRNVLIYDHISNIQWWPPPPDQIKRISSRDDYTELKQRFLHKTL